MSFGRTRKNLQGRLSIARNRTRLLCDNDDFKMKKLTIGVFTDSFPPTIDGVANATENYAKIIQQKYGEAVVAAPYYPAVRDNYSFKVIRYPSAHIGNNIGYRAGYPFDPQILYDLERRNIDIIHAHSPFVSAVLARMLRSRTGAPIVFTYHTKFDIELKKAVANNTLRRASVKFIVNNINACDEVWAVSEGAGQNLCGLGYKGKYTVVENGTDFERRKPDPNRVDKLKSEFEIPCDATVFLYVGRMRWYKGIKLSLDGLRAAKAKGEKFRFVVVGDGIDSDEIKEYSKQAGLEKECIFAGCVHDRERLRDLYAMSDVFLFPSAFDANGIVVREAAACGVPSVLIKNSSASEGIDDTVGILIDDTVEAMRDAVLFACTKKEQVRALGGNASQKIYKSWDQSVAKAYGRYKKIIDSHINKRNDNIMAETAFNDAIERLIF